MGGQGTYRKYAPGKDLVEHLGRRERVDSTKQRQMRRAPVIRQRGITNLTKSSDKREDKNDNTDSISFVRRANKVLLPHRPNKAPNVADRGRAAALVRINANKGRRY